jgi:arsenate reductase (thioredoxin)
MRQHTHDLNRKALVFPHIRKEPDMSEAGRSDAMRVLFLCTHNSSRSQMAEGMLRARSGGRYVVFSAGTHPRSVHPLAIQAMREIGIDISEAAGYRAKLLDEFIGQPPMDLVVTVCDEAAEECPFFPGARRQEHWGFPDPSAAMGTEAERLAAFRSVRDQIAARITTFIGQTSGKE